MIFIRIADGQRFVKVRENAHTITLRDERTGEEKPVTRRHLEIMYYQIPVLDVTPIDGILRRLGA